MKRSPLCLLTAAAFSFACCAPIAACEQQSADCSELGVSSSDAPKSTNAQSATIVVLIDLPNNDPSTIQRATDEVYSEVARQLANKTEVTLIGAIYTGDGNSVTELTCMDGTHRSFTYIPKHNNQVAMERKKRDYLSEVEKDITTTMKSLSHDNNQRGDFRSLLTWTKDRVKSQGSGDVNIILWSNFLSNGTDCLNIADAAPASSELAKEIVQRCTDQQLLPSFGETNMTVLGAGNVSDPAVTTFSTQLAAEFCTRLSKHCVVAQKEE